MSEAAAEPAQARDPCVAETKGAREGDEEKQEPDFGGG